MKVEVGKEYSGEELEETLGETNERLWAIGNDHVVVVAEDIGNDNYKVRGIISLDGHQGQERIQIEKEKLEYEGKLVDCPHCHKSPFLMVTVLGTVVYICPDCLYHEEPWERGD